MWIIQILAGGDGPSGCSESGVGFFEFVDRSGQAGAEPLWEKVRRVVPPSDPDVSAGYQVWKSVGVVVPEVLRYVSWRDI